MRDTRPLGYGDYLLVGMFIAVIIISMIPVITGVAFIEISPQNMAMILSILIPIGAMMAGVIFTYSLAQYTIERRFRNLALIFMAVNFMITTVLYFMTNVSMEGFFPFADHTRNRTIVAAFSLALAPSFLFVGVSERITLDKKRIIVAILWGGLLSPIVSLWFMFSPEPVFATTYPDGGLTPAAFLIVALIVPLFLIALYRYYSAWKKEHNRLDLAGILSIGLWMYAVSLFVLQYSPLQFMEMIWVSVFICGELIFAVATITYEIIEPQRRLHSLVELRTQQLNESKKEIEFYLNIWGHKIGNLLQSMLLYLEIFSSGTKSSDELSKMADTALAIGNETNQINQQVAALIKLKEQDYYELTPVNLNQILETTLAQIHGTYGSHCLVESESISSNVFVNGDEFLQLTLVNLFTYICKQTPNPNIRFTHKLDAELITLDFEFDGPKLPKDIEDSLFSKLQPTRTTLSLDLFMVKILMQRFGGFFRYDWLKESNHNQFVLQFKQVPSQDTESVSSHTHSQISDLS